MFQDFTIFLWLLKLGALVNLYLLANTLVPPASTADPHLLVPAQILFAVSGFRCLFPNQYKGQVVFHDTPLSSIFLTRLLATFAEVAFIYQLSHVLRLLNVDRLGWVDALSWLMVVQVVISQIFVWGAILTGRLALYFWEELGWAILVAANAVASAGLWSSRGALGDAGILGHINLLFGVVYLSWQVANLRLQIADARRAGETLRPATRVSWTLLGEGLRRSIRDRNRTTAATAWGEPDRRGVLAVGQDRGLSSGRGERAAPESFGGGRSRGRRRRFDRARIDARVGRFGRLHDQARIQLLLRRVRPGRDRIGARKPADVRGANPVAVRVRQRRQLIHAHHRLQRVRVPRNLLAHGDPITPLRQPLDEPAIARFLPAAPTGATLPSTPHRRQHERESPAQTCERLDGAALLARSSAPRSSCPRVQSIRCRAPERPGGLMTGRAGTAGIAAALWLAASAAHAQPLRAGLLLSTDDAFFGELRSVSSDGLRANDGIPRRIVWVDGAPVQVVALVEWPPPHPVLDGARSVSADGLVFAGYEGLLGNHRAAIGRDMQVELLELLEPPVPGGDSEAEDLSADGTVVVGSDGGRALRWVDGVPTELGTLPGAPDVFAAAVSDDGRVVVGRSGLRAFRWEAGSMTELEVIPGSFSIWAKAEDVSADGSVIVGQTLSPRGFEAFRWEAGQMVGLGDLPGSHFESGASGVSADGSVVVGWGTAPGGVNHAFVWESSHGILDLLDLLRYGYGVEVPTEFHGGAYAVSADGQIVVGWQWGAGFVAAIPASCADGLDNDGDGFADFPADPGCSSASDRFEIAAGRACDDGHDGDGDGYVDFPDDPGCAGPLAAREDPACDNDLDDDGDGGIDSDGGPAGGAPDPQCTGRPGHGSERARGCGLGIELVMLAPLLARIARRRALAWPRRRRAPLALAQLRGASSYSQR